MQQNTKGPTEVEPLKIGYLEFSESKLVDSCEPEQAVANRVELQFGEAVFFNWVGDGAEGLFQTFQFWIQ